MDKIDTTLMREENKYAAEIGGYDSRVDLLLDAIDYYRLEIKKLKSSKMCNCGKCGGIDYDKYYPE
jgi:hypothetical protein